ncbi:hypothetical protein [Croceicoccus naphthovorans]|uniref:hypothetical protein n=1 Tax=Croceicoccus naphthovorans TaxID=1348774 RepID=UPI0012E08C3F|nr:hypothetical protein [Croceicoccus naphthovorans]MBB3988850.1 hypothetical protein [Croceicoccus naphthovorans]
MSIQPPFKVQKKQIRRRAGPAGYTGPVSPWANAREWSDFLPRCQRQNRFKTGDFGGFSDESSHIARLTAEDFAAAKSMLQCIIEKLGGRGAETPRPRH